MPSTSFDIIHLQIGRLAALQSLLNLAPQRLDRPAPHNVLLEETHNLTSICVLIFGRKPLSASMAFSRSRVMDWGTC